jgi:flagellar protein FliO/FliZ
MGWGRCASQPGLCTAVGGSFMWTIVTWVIILAVLAAVAAVAAFFIKAHLSGESPSAVFFKPRAEPRLSVVEFANIDGKRKLILIRRDDIEHLIMTGGPVDIVVENGIEVATEPQERVAAHKEPSSFRDSATFKEAPTPAVSSPVPRSLSQIALSSVDDVEAALKR